MATEGEPKVEDKALAAAGATGAETNDGQSRSGEGAPKAPVIPNAPDPKAGKEEEHGKAKEPTAEEKAAADKKVADDAAAKAAEEAAKAAPKVDLKEYITLDDPAGQAAIDLLKEAGVTPNEANAIFEKAIVSGNLADIDVQTLEAKIGKAKATLVMAGVTDYYTRESDKATAAVESVHKIVGGEEAWATLRTWAQAKEKTDKGFKANLDTAREMLDKGGLYAETAGRELLRMYNEDPTTKGLNNGQLQIGDKIIPGSAGTPLSRADYVTALKEANQRNASPAEIAAIDARRMAGRSQGI